MNEGEEKMKREAISKEEANEIKTLLSENGGHMGVSTICRRIKSIKGKSYSSWSQHGLRIYSCQRYGRKCFSVRCDG